MIPFGLRHLVLDRPSRREDFPSGHERFTLRTARQSLGSAEEAVEKGGFAFTLPATRRGGRLSPSSIRGLQDRRHFHLSHHFVHESQTRCSPVKQSPCQEGTLRFFC